jgi:hypothetical protein
MTEINRGIDHVGNAVVDSGPKDSCRLDPSTA